jgi:predicted signal transduction protein with EAL and GGDEF domain
MPIVLFEAHATDFDSTMEEVNLLKHLGYRFAWIQPLGTGYKKYAKLLAMLINGQKIRQICTAESIPRADHSMIIAVPLRWQPLLGME